MNGVELALPEAVISTAKLMGSRGFGGGGGGDVGASIGKVEIGRSEANSAAMLSSVDSYGQRDPAFLFKIPDSRRYLPNSQRPSSHSIDNSKELKHGVNASQALISGSEAKQLQRSGKVSRSNSGSLKRPRVVQLSLPLSENGEEDRKSNSGVGASPIKSINAEKAQLTKQKSNSNVKRADKRNGRTPRSRSDSFCLKNGFNFSSVGGGGNFLAYGSKSDIFDVAKPIDELPLDALLDGSYKRPRLENEKGKDVRDLNENLLNSVRKACAVLQLGSPVPIQNSVEVDNNYNQKVSVGPISSGSSSSSRMDSKADSSTVSGPSTNKDSSGDVKSPAFTIDSLLIAPRDVLERLALPPSKELDSLLLDAVKPASSSRNATELRMGKSTSYRNGLPPFTWSINSSGSSKSGADAVRISASRTACPGRWVKVGNTLTPSEDSDGSLVDIQSLTFDQRLVPVGKLESVPLGVERFSSKCVSISPSEVELTSTACSASMEPAVDYSPRLLDAAETLCGIASHSLYQSSQEASKSVNKPSQKIAEACNFKLTQRSMIPGVAHTASAGRDNVFKASDAVFSSRIRLDKRTDTGCLTNLCRKEPINGSAPRSIRSSPSKPLRDSDLEKKPYKNNIINRSFMMPPPTSRVIDRACSSSRQKLKQIGSAGWNNSAAKNLD
ncbi:OLC1v1029878C1 [Oldenlandia corymbosa var. corymbosa]|uniref:OLC1v1029878C1 n=1 Tax=Oldenlandia corymbosa var. corymbosa TaxID=529605 RepID=A0AAV1CGT6_OLDCO|nr:OLC1v1029878C1 [Oldenlandia corymbosa var. corymbosa]